MNLSVRRPVSVLRYVFPLMVASAGLLCASGLSTAAADEPAASLNEHQAELRSAAYDHQKQQNWSAARRLWRKLRDQLPADRAFALYRQEAERNIQLLEPLDQPPREPVRELTLPDDPDQREQAPPERLPQEHFLKYYPVGKQVKNVAILNVTGQGTNRDWVFEGTAHFAFQHRIAVESEVIENTGTRLVTRLVFGEVAQTRAVSNRELQLRMPEASLVRLVWEQLEDEVLRHLPVYSAASKLAGIAQVIDPRGRRTLTWFANRLRRFGAQLDDSDDIELLARTDKLDGLRLQVEYVSGLGVTRIEVLDGEAFDPDDLEQLAYHLSLLLDYYIFPGAEKQPGERWQVRAEDVIALLNLGHEFQARGRLSIERDRDRRTPDKESQAVLKLVSGEVHLEESRPGRGQEATIRPRSGVLYYSQQDLLIREARIAWEASSFRFSTDHLLFGTERLRNLQVETYYEAERTDQGAR